MIKKQTVDLNWADPAVRLTAFLPEDEAEGRCAVLVLPGGGYQVCAPAEGAPVAERFAAEGCAAFLLEYSVRSTGGEHCLFPEPLREVATAVAHIRGSAAAYGVDPDRIALLGASAGGHLAASYCNGWDTEELCEGIAEDPETLKPNACVLLYGAADIGAEGMMQQTMFGHAAPYSDEELERCSVREYVGPQTPPTVLFHSATDPWVPMRSSLELFSALQREGVPSELHIFGSGLHGLGLGEGTAIEPWPDLALRFLDSVFTQPETFDPAYARRLQEKLFPEISE